MARAHAIRLTMLFMLLGFIANVLVSQACGWWNTDQTNRHRLYAGANDAIAEVWLSTSFGVRHASWRTIDDLSARMWRKIREQTPLDQAVQPPSAIPSWCSARSALVREQHKLPGTFSARSLQRVLRPNDAALGFPFPSFSTSYLVDDLVITGNRISDVRTGHVVESVPYRLRILAFKPLPPGLLANSMLYALAMASPFLAIAATRYRRRQRAGHCLKCDYDRKHDYTTPCPECGSSD